jgi:hypothetical protein
LALIEPDNESGGSEMEAFRPTFPVIEVASMSTSRPPTQDVANW